MSEVSLKSLLVPSKSTEMEFPGMPGFTVNLSFLSRETLLSIRRKATTTAFKNRQPVEKLDEDLFLKLYVENAVKGWNGLKFSYLEQLAPVDVAGQNPDDCLAFSPDNALYLMKNSAEFDSFVSDAVNDLANFSTNSSKS